MEVPLSHHQVLRHSLMKGKLPQTLGFSIGQFECSRYSSTDQKKVPKPWHRSTTSSSLECFSFPEGPLTWPGHTGRQGHSLVCCGVDLGVRLGRASINHLEPPQTRCSWVRSLLGGPASQPCWSNHAETDCEMAKAVFCSDRKHGGAEARALPGIIQSLKLFYF